MKIKMKKKTHERIVKKVAALVLVLIVAIVALIAMPGKIGKQIILKL